MEALRSNMNIVLSILDWDFAPDVNVVVSRLLRYYAYRLCHPGDSRLDKQYEQITTYMDTAHQFIQASQETEDMITSQENASMKEELKEFGLLLIQNCVIQVNNMPDKYPPLTTYRKEWKML